MHLFHYFPLFAGLAAALPAANAPSSHLKQRQSAPQGVQVAEIAYSGSGCGAKSYPAQSLSDPTTISVPKTNFTAEAGKSQAQVVDTRTTCQILIKVNQPSGWQYSIAKADYYGRVHLPAGVTGISTTTYSFSGDTKKVSKAYYFDGPFDGLYYRNDRIVDTDRIWSACGSAASLNITAELRVAPLTGQSSTRPASIEIFAPLGGKVGISWRTCT
ncbi:hypothetical protein B0H63DRAFT_559286 [Podospora didyma]|uniref:Secreted protein n=1 Tax=Podospora didyma TaxID=330526 RepID=A0AAE0NUD2_9PEZI|nr:hypothetical protein B0H63DRAFT_559286 [Podospora didyma]